MTLFDYHNINFVKLKKSERLGLSYMGSKRNLADDILKVIYDYNPNAYAFYDLFGGGGSMSLYAKKCGYDVFYNDLDKHIYSVIDYFKKHKNNLDSRLYDFLSREEFYKIKEKENKTPLDYVMLYLHSFSNNFKVYFCKKDDEEYYKHFHNLVVKNSYESACYFDSYALRINSIGDIFKKFMIHSDFKKLDVFKRRLLFIDILKKIDFIGIAGLKNRFKDISLFNLMDIKKIDMLKKVGADADYSKIEAYIRDREEGAGKYSLKTLGSLNLLLKSDFSDIEISNKSYSEVEIKHAPNDCIIYCDIPYKNTGKYIESFNHSEFYKWCFEKKEQGYNVFVSEYDMPLEFKCIFEKEHTKKSGVQNNLKTIERLYTL